MDKIAKRKVVDNIDADRFDLLIQFKDKYLQDMPVEEISFRDILDFARRNLAKKDECRNDPKFKNFIDFIIERLNIMKKEDIRKLRNKIIDLEEAFDHNVNIFNLYKENN